MIIIKDKDKDKIYGWPSIRETYCDVRVHLHHRRQSKSNSQFFEICTLHLLIGNIVKIMTFSLIAMFHPYNVEKMNWSAMTNNTGVNPPLSTYRKPNLHQIWGRVRSRHTHPPLDQQSSALSKTLVDIKRADHLSEVFEPLSISRCKKISENSTDSKK